MVTGIEVNLNSMLHRFTRFSIELRKKRREIEEANNIVEAIQEAIESRMWTAKLDEGVPWISDEEWTTMIKRIKEKTNMQDSVLESLDINIY